MESLYHTVMPGDGDKLKKRVWVVPFLDQAGVGEKKMAQIAADLEGLLEKNGHFLIKKGIETAPSSQIVLMINWVADFKYYFSMPFKAVFPNSGISFFQHNINWDAFT